MSNCFLGFELGSAYAPGSYTGTQSTVVRDGTGSYSCYLDAAGEYANLSAELFDYPTQTSGTYVWFGAAIMSNDWSNFTGANNHFYIRDSIVTSANVALNFDAGTTSGYGNIIVKDAGGSTLTTLEDVLEDGVWAYIEVFANQHDTNGLIDVYINGEEVYSATAQDFVINGASTSLFVKIPSTETSATMYVDDMYIRSSSLNLLTPYGPIGVKRYDFSNTGTSADYAYGSWGALSTGTWDDAHSVLNMWSTDIISDDAGIGFIHSDASGNAGPAGDTDIASTTDIIGAMYGFRAMESLGQPRDHYIAYGPSTQVESDSFTQQTVSLNTSTKIQFYCWDTTSFGSSDYLSLGIGANNSGGRVFECDMLWAQVVYKIPAATGNTLTAGGATASLTAGTATFKRQLKMTATGAAASLSAGIANFARKYRLTATGATPTLAAGDAGYKRHYWLEGAGAALDLTAGNVTLTAAGAEIMPATGDTLSLAAGDATLKRHLRVLSEGGTLSLTAGVVDLYHAAYLELAGATLSLTAGDLTAKRHLKLGATGAAMNLTAGDANLNASTSDTMIATGAALSMTAGDMTAKRHLKLTATGDAHDLTAGDATLTAATVEVMPATGATVDMLAGDIIFKRHLKLDIDAPGPVLLTAGDANYNYVQQSSMEATGDALDLFAGTAEFRRGYGMTAQGASLALTAGQVSFGFPPIDCEGAALSLLAGSANLSYLPVAGRRIYIVT